MGNSPIGKYKTWKWFVQDQATAYQFNVKGWVEHFFVGIQGLSQDFEVANCVYKKCPKWSGRKLYKMIRSGKFLPIKKQKLPVKMMGMPGPS